MDPRAILLLKQALVALFAHLEDELDASAAHEVAERIAAHLAGGGGEELAWLLDMEDARDSAHHSAEHMTLWLTMVREALAVLPHTLEDLLKQGFVGLTAYIMDNIDPDTAFHVAQRIEAALRIVNEETLAWVHTFHDTKRSSEHPRSDKTAWMLFVADTLAKNNLNS
jgi:hypothetical protein